MTPSSHVARTSLTAGTMCRKELCILVAVRDVCFEVSVIADYSYA